MKPLPALIFAAMFVIFLALLAAAVLVNLRTFRTLAAMPRAVAIPPVASLEPTASLSPTFTLAHSPTASLTQLPPSATLTQLPPSATPLPPSQTATLTFTPAPSSTWTTSPIELTLTAYQTPTDWPTLTPLPTWTSGPTATEWIYLTSTSWPTWTPAPTATDRPTYTPTIVISIDQQLDTLGCDCTQGLPDADPRELDCGNFRSSWTLAQACFDRCWARTGLDVYELDGDNPPNNVACEYLQ